MSKVVRIAPPPVMVWVCGGCGSASFELRNDGLAFCHGCDEVLSVPNGAWFEQISGSSAIVTEPPNHSFAGNSDNGEFARRLAMRAAAESDWIICGKNGGPITEWAKIRLNEADRAELLGWINAGVDELMKEVAK